MEGNSLDMLSTVRSGFQEITAANSEILKLLDLLGERQSGQQADSEDDCDNTKSKARKKRKKLPSAIAVEKEEQNWEENQTFATSDIDQSLTETESSSIDNRLREIESDGENSDDQVNSLQETDSEDQPRVELDNNSNKSDTDQSSWEQESVADDDELLQRCLRSKITKLHQDNRLHDDFKENLFEYTRNDRESESTGSDIGDESDVEEEEVLPAEIVEFYAKEIDQTAWKEVDRVTIDVESWRRLAKSESKNGWLARALHGDGVNTIFCLDISTSMMGKPLKQAKAFIKQYIQGIQNTNPKDSGYEHVALVTFGGETRVQQHLTTQYFELLTKLECVRPNGPSPLFAGLRMCWAAIDGAGISSSSLDDVNCPKVYLLTDGRVTPTSFFAGPDTCTEDEEKLVENQVLHYCIYLHKTYHLCINAVCVSDCKMSILEEITAQTNGEMVTTGNWTLDPEPAESQELVVSTDDDGDYDNNDDSQQSIRLLEKEQHIEDEPYVRNGGYQEELMKVECYDHIGRYFQQFSPQRPDDETAAEDANRDTSPPVREGVSMITENLKAEETFSWRWKDPGGAWKTYSEETNKTIESHYEKDPRGFVLITHDNKQYKIIFSRMVKIDMNTKEKFPVSRR